LFASKLIVYLQINSLFILTISNREMYLSIDKLKKVYIFWNTKILWKSCKKFQPHYSGLHTI